jgi:anti-anti-sigma factor
MLSKSTESNITILSCSCDVTAENFFDFKSRYNDVIANLNEGTALILDLSSVNHLVSSAIGVIAASYPLLKGKQVAFRLVADSGELMRLLRVTRLSKVVRTCNCVKSAISELQ